MKVKTETPEEKEVLDMIDNTPAQCESLAEVKKSQPLNKMFGEFSETYGLKSVDLDANALHKAYRLIDDEVMELNQELMCRDPHAAVKEMADIVYITLERMFNMNIDLDAVMNEVHRSNLSKRVSADNIVEEMAIAAKRYPDVIDLTLDGETFVMKCEKTGKVIKPTTYSTAKITDEMIGL